MRKAATTIIVSEKGSLTASETKPSWLFPHISGGSGFKATRLFFPKPSSPAQCRQDTNHPGNQTWQKLITLDKQHHLMNTPEPPRAGQNQQWSSLNTGMVHTTTISDTKYTDCNLRQGAGGMKIARNGSIILFLKRFYKRSQMYFGQKPEEYSFSIKKRCLEVKN